MGRFFKTARANFVDDKMFELPVDLMYKVINKTDENIGENLDKIDAFGDLLDTENLKTDDPAVNERLGYFRDKMADMSSAIHKNPLDYKNFSGKIAATSRELQTELDTGTLGRAQEQHDTFNTRMEEIGELEGVSADKKDLVKRATLQKYADQNGLDYVNGQTYNDVGELIDTPLKDVDTDALINTIASNFKADTTASASSGPSGGYIWTSKGTVEIRSEEDVANYMKNSLKENGWEAQQRQQYEWQKTVGELPRNEDGTERTIDELIEADRTGIIDAAKNKLGYRKETLTKNASVDSRDLAELKMKRQDEEAGTGKVLHDVIDPRSADWNEDEIKTIKKNEAAVNKILINTNSTSIDDLLTKVYNKEGNKTSFKDLDNVLSESGISRQEFVDYVNYTKGIEDLKTPTKVGYNDEDARDRAEQESTLGNLVESWNNMNFNEPVEKIRIAYSDGTYHNLEHKTLGGLIEDDRGFVYIPSTGSTSSKLLSKNSSGHFLDSEGEVIRDENRIPIKSEAQAVKAGVEQQISYDTSKVASFDTDKVLFKATKGNFRENDYERYNTNGTINKGKEYIVTRSYYRIDPRGGRTLVQLQGVVPSSRLSPKQ